MTGSSEQAQTIARLTPLAIAIAWVGRVTTAVPARRVPVAQAASHVLAADIVIAESRPAASLALRDGWALVSEDTADAGGYAPAPLLHNPVRVDTGARLPAEADAVAPVEAVTNAAEALAPFAPGEGVLPAGADAVPGVPVCRAGTRLRLTDIAALRALGVAEVDVRIPRVRLAAAPDDVVIDAIATFLTAAVTQAGAVVDRVAGDDADDGCDLLVIVGGTGTGRRDASVSRLAKRGRLDIHGLALSPGETAALGVVGTTPVVLVPGRLDAAIAVWLTLGRRLVAQLAGGDVTETSRPALLTRKIASPLGFADLVLVRREGDGVAPIASGYLSLSALAEADGWVLVPPDSEGYQAGTSVTVSALP